MNRDVWVLFGGATLLVVHGVGEGAESAAIAPPPVVERAPAAAPK